VSRQPGFSDKVAVISSLVEVLPRDVKALESSQFLLPFLELRRLEYAPKVGSNRTETGRRATPALECCGRASQYASHRGETVQ
jgi:hypothetical protein